METSPTHNNSSTTTFKNNLTELTSSSNSSNSTHSTHLTSENFNPNNDNFLSDNSLTTESIKIHQIETSQPEITTLQNLNLQPQTITATEIQQTNSTPNTTPNNTKNMETTTVKNPVVQISLSTDPEKEKNENTSPVLPTQFVPPIQVDLTTKHVGQHPEVTEVSRSNILPIVLGAAIPTIILLTLLALFCFYKRHQIKKQRKNTYNSDIENMSTSHHDYRKTETLQKDRDKRPYRENRNKPTVSTIISTSSIKTVLEDEIQSSSPEKNACLVKNKPANSTSSAPQHKLNWKVSNTSDYVSDFSGTISGKNNHTKITDINNSINSSLNESLSTFATEKSNPAFPATTMPVTASNLTPRTLSALKSVDTSKSYRKDSIPQNTFISYEYETPDLDLPRNGNRAIYHKAVINSRTNSESNDSEAVTIKNGRISVSSNTTTRPRKKSETPVPVPRKSRQNLSQSPANTSHHSQHNSNSSQPSTPRSNKLSNNKNPRQSIHQKPKILDMSSFQETCYSPSETDNHITLRNTIISSKDATPIDLSKINTIHHKGGTLKINYKVSSDLDQNLNYDNLFEKPETILELIRNNTESNLNRLNNGNDVNMVEDDEDFVDL